MNGRQLQGWWPARGQRWSRRNLLIGALAVIVVGVGLYQAVRLTTRSTHRNDNPPSASSSSSPQHGQVSVEAAPPAGGQAAPEVPPVPSKAANDPRWAFVLLGYGGGNHDGAYLTDSIMVAIVDPSQKTLTLLSVPRDAWVPLVFDGKTASYSKLNTAYAYALDSSLYENRLSRYTGSHGAGSLVKDTVSRLLGIPIANYLALDFAGFREMIDAVGGIDVAVPDSFSAQYPVNDDPSVDPRWTTVRFTKGLEHMNGERAIEFARAREVIDNPSEASDFARSSRQRIIIEAFKTTLFRPGGVIHLPQLLNIASKHVDTDYGIPDLGQLGQLIMDWKNLRIYQAAISTDNYLEAASGPAGAYVLIPVTADHSWAQIRAFARRLWQDPATGVGIAETRIKVVNDTGIAGLAARFSAALAELGYLVGASSSGEQQAQSRLFDGTGGQAGPVIQQLEKDLGVHFGAAAPATGIESGNLVLALGADDASVADLAVNADVEAPVSVAGVEAFGGWTPAMPEPTLTPTSIATSPSTPPSTPAARPTPLLTNGKIVVPSVIGLAEAAARDIIDSVGLSNAYSNYQGPGDVPASVLNGVPPGHVLSQTPAPGTLLPPGAPVYLAVRKP